MSEYDITLLPSNQRFTVRENELILNAAIREGVDIAYSCRNGTCRTCLFQIISGDVQMIDVEHCMISEQELENNRRLLCMSMAKSHAVLEKKLRKRNLDG